MSLSASVHPYVNIECSLKLTLCPADKDQGIAVEPFLQATEDLTKLFDFINATAFAPVKSDMTGNIKVWALTSQH
jgi:hypothetical protein